MKEPDRGVTSTLETTSIETDIGQRYVAPRVQVLNEEEALSAFQATAAGTAMWWIP
jgi:hypothetical protein